jgi:vacuolar-type H+-ATPase subunit I/STV1
MRGGTNLADLKAIESQDKILEKLQKVTAKRIENSIKRDLESKTKKW